MPEHPTTTMPAAPRGMLALLTAAAFVIFAQIFMVAPLIPRLAEVFQVPPGLVGLAVPAYLLPYGAMVLVWGPASEHLGRRPVILGSLAAFTVLVGATALAGSAGAFIGMRLATAIGASGVVPISLALVGDLVPYQRRGHALGWLFGGMAGGIAVGATAEALGEPLIGWSGLVPSRGCGRAGATSHRTRCTAQDPAGGGAARAAHRGRRLPEPAPSDPWTAYLPLRAHQRVAALRDLHLARGVSAPAV